MKSLINGIVSIKWFLGTLVTGAYLILLYVVTLWLVVGSLSAIQVRDNHDAGNLPFTFGEDDTATAQEYLFRAKRRITDALYFSDYSEVEHRMERLLEQITNAFPDRISFSRFSNQAEMLNSVELADIEDLCAKIEDPRCRAVHQLQQEREAFRAQQENGTIPTQADIEARALKELASLREFTEFVDLNTFFATMRYNLFLNAPREILVMILTIVMGVLGSVITMTWSFVRRDTGYSLRRMMLLPFVGCMSAFIILVFLKAGQLTLTSGESNDPLSPFVLSFVGIVSGLLSERAYARMSEVGSNFFAVNEDVPRWGIQLEQAMAQAGLNHGEVAQYLQTDEVKAKDIIDGRASATLGQQYLIAACLRADRREIFTDLPPQAAQADPPPPGQGGSG